MSPESALQHYVATRDPKTFQLLVRKYESFVYAICCRMLNSADAEDAAQDVFFKLMRHADRVQEDAAGWLHRCAVNTCRDILRRNRTRRSHEANHAIPVGESSDVSGSQVLAEIDEALLQLDDQDRLLLTRYYLEGETQQSIAAASMVNQSTVQRRIEVALERLRKVLSQRGVVAVGGGLAAAMSTSSTQAAVPASLSNALTKLTLSSPPLVTAAITSIGSPTKGSSIYKIVASVLVVVGIGGGGAWTYSRLATSGPTDGTAIKIAEHPEQAFFRQEVNLANAPAFPTMIEEVRDAARQAGHSPTGPAVFLHPEGIGTSPETSLIVAFPVSATAEGSDTIVSLARQTMISVKSRPSENPYEVIDRLTAAAAESGYQRTFQDRFVNLDSAAGAGFAFEVQLGIRRSD